MYYNGWMKNGDWGQSQNVMDFSAGGVTNAWSGNQNANAAPANQQYSGFTGGINSSAGNPYSKLGSNINPVAAVESNSVLSAKPKPDVKPGGDSAGLLGIKGMDFGTLAGVANTAASWYMGNKQLDQAQEQFDFQKESWEKRFAMMQDQYYRKLNNRRAGMYLDEGMSEADRRKLGEHYDTGENQTTPYPGSSSQAPAGSFNNSGFVGPTQQNADMMNQATGGAPFSPEAAQSMMNSSAFTRPPMSGASEPTNPANATDATAGRESAARAARAKRKPKTQSTDDTGTAQTTSEKIG